MDKILPGLAVLSIIVVAFALVAAGWRGRLKRQSDVESLAAVPAGLSPATVVVDGQYVATTTARDWLDRIAARGLGIRTNAEASVHAEGILFDREGAGPLFIPRAALSGSRKDSGMAGKFVEKDGLVVVTWTLGSRELDTGFRTRRAADKQPFLQALQELISAAPQADADSGK